MIINIGSTNPIKIEALEEIVKEYSLVFSNDVSICAYEIPSGVPEQPIGLSQIIKGAKTRAENSYKLGNCTYGIGIESGIYEIHDTWFDTCASVIFYGGHRSIGSSMDSREFNLIGLSSSFPIPTEVVSLIKKENLNLGQALHKLGLTKKEDLRVKEGAIGLLTKNRVNRKEQTKQALRMALVTLENPEMFYPK